MLDLLARFQDDSGHQGVCIAKVQVVHSYAAKNHRTVGRRGDGWVGSYRTSTRAVKLYYAAEEPVGDGVAYRMLHELCHAWDFQTDFNSFESPLWDHPEPRQNPYRTRTENFANLCGLGGLGWQLATASSSCNGLDPEQLSALGAVWQGLDEPSRADLGQPGAAQPPPSVSVDGVDVQLWEGELVVHWSHDDTSPGATRERIDPQTGARRFDGLWVEPSPGEGAGYASAPEFEPLVPYLFAISSASSGGTTAYMVGQTLSDMSSVYSVVVVRADGFVEFVPCLQRAWVLGDERGLWLVEGDAAGLRWWRLAGEG